MDYIIAFLVGGLICAIGQLIVDGTKLTISHTMVLYVVAGSVLTGLGIYEPLVRFAGGGATVPVSNFGFVLTKGVVDHLQREGLFGALTGVFDLAGAAIAASIFFGLLASVIFQPRG